MIKIAIILSSLTSSLLWKIIYFVYFLEMIYLSICFPLSTNCQFFADNSPPSMYFDRRWRIDASQPIGSKIVQVHGTDQETKNLTFGLEKIDNPFDNNAADKQQMEPLPFRINPKTGDVYVNASLSKLAGKNLHLYVTLTDGALTTKTEAYVTILNDTNDTMSQMEDGATMRQPWLTFVPPFQENLPVKKLTTPSKHDNVARKTNTSTIIPVGGGDNFQGEKTTPIGAILGIVGGVTLIILVTLAMIVAVRHNKRLTELSKNGNDEKTTPNKPTTIIGLNDTWHGPMAANNRYESDNSASAITDTPPPPLPPGDRWEFPRHHLKFFTILGEGAFGQVWRCEAKSCHFFDTDTICDSASPPTTNDSSSAQVSVVAVKTLKESANQREKSDLMTELTIMKAIAPHPNVIRLLGCCTEKEPIFLIMEFMSLGKLQSHLRNSRAELQYYTNRQNDDAHAHAQISHTLTSRDLTSYCHQVAKGMDYLTTRHGIIHRDLAARNVLINDAHCCKVADFGFARDVMTSHVYERKSEGRLPIRWMAPESLYDNLFSVKSDVWSFGILMWEVVTLGSTPYPGMSAADVMRRVREGYRLEKPEHCRRELYNIMFYCWDREPGTRPSFGECCQFLEKLILTETDYIELERFPDHSYYNMLSLGGVDDGEKL